MIASAKKSKNWNQRWWPLLVGLAVLTLGVAGGGDPARSAPVTLQNDGFLSGGSAAFNAGFVTGEMGAVTLGPVNENYQINEIRLLFGPVQPAPNDPVTVNLRIYNDTGVINPGTEVFFNSFQLTPATDALHTLDISSANLMMAAGASFRVAVELLHDGAPSIARDDNGITAGRNWIFTGGTGWVSSDSLGVPGDWIIRAVVETLGVPGPDGGVLDGGVLDGGVLDGTLLDGGLLDAGGSSCTDSTDCFGGQVCRDHECRTLCTDSTDCQGGEICDDGLCTPACVTSYDCHGGEACFEQLCRTLCSDNADCGAGETCNGQVCLDDLPVYRDNSACGCRSGAPGGPATLLLLLLVALGVLRRRRRRWRQ